MLTVFRGGVIRIVIRKYCMDLSKFYLSAIIWSSVLKYRFQASATTDGLYHPDRRLNPGCWLWFWFESLWERLLVSFYQLWTLLLSVINVPCLDLGLINRIQHVLHILSSTVHYVWTQPTINLQRSVASNGRLAP